MDVCRLLIAVLLACTGSALGGDEILPLSEVQPGMKGYGLTVVSGEKVERFDVEVIGVLPNATPARAMILVNVSGLGLEHSGIVAGMSGSPVYFGGRLAGAISAGWGFSKDPIGVVTPIESMLTIEGPGARPVRLPRASPSPSGAAGGSPRMSAALSALTLPDEERLRALKGDFEKLLPAAGAAPSLLAPLSAGFPGETLGRFQDALGRMGLVLPASSVATAGSGRLLGTTSSSISRSPGEPVVGGSAITALLVDGDLSLGATGTVTRVEKDGRFVAFGHPFLGWGDLELPVAAAHVVTVLPNLFQSFKLGYPLAPSYRLTKDRDSGVAGHLDHPAPMVPVSFRFESDSEPVQTLAWRIAPHPRLLPILLAISSDAALTVADPTPRERTLDMKVSIETIAGPFVYRDELTGTRARDIALLTAATLASAIVDNDMEDPQISAIALSFRSSAGERRLRVQDAALASSARVAPGDTIVATVRLLDRRGGSTAHAVRLRVPLGAPEGKATLVIGDGATISALRLALEPGEPRSLADFRRALSRLLPQDRLVAALVVPSRGASTGPDTLSALPPTMASLLSEAGESPEARKPVGARLLAEEILTFDRPVSGSVRLELEIERRRS